MPRLPPFITPFMPQEQPGGINLANRDGLFGPGYSLNLGGAQQQPRRRQEPFRSTARAHGFAEALAYPVSVESGTVAEAIAEALAAGIRGRTAYHQRLGEENLLARELERQETGDRRDSERHDLEMQNLRAQILAGQNPEVWSDPYELGGAQVQRNQRTGQVRSVIGPPPISAQPQQWGPMSPDTQAQYPNLNPGDVQQNRVTGEIRPIPGAQQRQRATERQQRAVQSAMSSLEATDRVIGAVLDARQRVERNPTWTTGWLGARLRGVEGSDAFGLDRAIDTIKANLGFEALQQMRQESPTGGALGQVAVIELQMLQAVIDSLDSAQNHRDLLAALDNVDAYLRSRGGRLQRFLEAYQQDFGGVAMGAPSDGGGGPPQGIPPEEWSAMTPEERARVQELMR